MAEIKEKLNDEFMAAVESIQTIALVFSFSFVLSFAFAAFAFGVQYAFVVAAAFVFVGLSVYGSPLLPDNKNKSISYTKELNENQCQFYCSILKTINEHPDCYSNGVLTHIKQLKSMGRLPFYGEYKLIVAEHDNASKIIDKKEAIECINKELDKLESKDKSVD